MRHGRSGSKDSWTGSTRSFATGLKSCRIRTIVTSHAAFGHLARRYRLTQVPIAGIDPTNEPTPSELADISALVRREGITTVFTEELVSPAVAKTVARETGARTATLDPIEGLAKALRRDLPVPDASQPRRDPESELLLMTPVPRLSVHGASVTLDGRPVLRRVDLEVA